MALKHGKKGSKGVGTGGPGRPGTPQGRRGRPEDPDEALTAAAIAREYGGTAAQWAALIRARKLPGPSGAHPKARRSAVRAYVARAVVRALDTDAPPPPVVVVRDGVAYLAGTPVPVRRLWRALQAGSSEADLRAAFPGLPPGASRAVARYALSNPQTVARWKRLLPPTPAPAAPGEEDDDGQGFDAELEDLLASRAELFRRLAQ